MTPQPAVIKQSELLNQLVLNRDTMEELGRIEILWMYAPSNRVLGFVSKSGFLGNKKLAFKLTQVVALGANGVLIHAQPEATNAEKVSKLETLIHCEVWSDSGEKVGKITDYIFNLKTGEISKYLFVSSGLGGITGEIYELAPTQILSLGRRRVLVPNYAVASFTLYRGGIKQKLTQAGEFFQEEKTEVIAELKTITKLAQETTEQAKGRFFSLREQVQDRARSLAQQAKETVQIFNEQLQEEAQILAEQARERSQHLAEQVREQSHNLSEQVEDGIQTLTVQAREILDPDEDETEWETGGVALEEDPEDFFDALFREEEESERGRQETEGKGPKGGEVEQVERSGQTAESLKAPEVAEPAAIAEDPLDPWTTPSDHAAAAPIPPEPNHQSEPNQKPPNQESSSSPWDDDEPWL